MLERGGEKKQKRIKEEEEEEEEEEETGEGRVWQPAGVTVCIYLSLFIVYEPFVHSHSHSRMIQSLRVCSTPLKYVW